MNGNPDPNYPETGPAGSYPGANPHENYAGSYSAAGSDPTGRASAQSYAAGDRTYAGATADPYSYATPGSVPPAGSVPPPGAVPNYAYGAPVPVPGSPNPGLAALLGFIPGVGAMYNGQFAKGIAHIVIFAVLTSLSEHLHGLEPILGLLTAGWYFYMVLDAYQTARARRDGLIAPDPFGLNNIGERFGMPHNPNWGDFMARPAAGSSATAAADSARTSNPYAGPAVDPAGGAPAGAYAAAPPYTAVPPYGAPIPGAGEPYVTPPPSAAYAPGTVPPWHPGYPETLRQQAYADMGGAPNYPYQPAYAPATPAGMPPYPPQPASGIPVGAIWLIGLGVLALAGSLAHNVYWGGYFFGAAACFILGVILLVQQTSAARKVYTPGTAAYQWNLLHQARFGLVLLLIGVLQIIAGMHVTGWHYLWPYLLIFVGLLQLADRSLYNRMLLEGPAIPNGYAPVPPASTPASPTEEEVR